MTAIMGRTRTPILTLMVPLTLMLVLFHLASPAEINFEEIGGIPDDSSYKALVSNRQLLNSTLNGLQPNDIFILPNKSFHLIGGVYVYDMYNITMKIEGTLSFSDNRDTWPVDSNGKVLEALYFENTQNLIVTSTGKGTFDGNGKAWWGAIKFLKNQEDRPRLWHMKHSKNVLVENLLLKDSPYWTFYCEDTDGLIIRYTDVDARWTDIDAHTPLDLTAFNTDGFDVTGNNVHIHDCTIWNQDDCVAVKDDSTNMLIERISCSGLGLVIGSIGGSRVHNITFRDSVMPNTVKGIYMKTRWSDSGPVGDSASISDILFENITIDKPQQFAIWIGPAQQTGQPCSLLWPELDHAECKMSGYQTWSNIVLRDIRIIDPKHSPGLMFGNTSNPMSHVVFDNVVVSFSGDDEEDERQLDSLKPWGPDHYYYC